MASVNGMKSTSETTGEEKVTNIHGESLTSRVEKYKIENEQTLENNSTPSSSRSGSVTNLSERGRYVPPNIRPKASPTNSAAARAQKNKSRSTENILAQNGRQQTTNGQPITNGSTTANGIDRTLAAEENVPISIPRDGNIQHFTVDELATFFRHMRVQEHTVQRLKHKQLDGRRFGKLKDRTLEELGMKNPIIVYFRDRSSKDKAGFML